MEIFTDDIRDFDSCEDIDIIAIKCKLLELQLAGNSPDYIRGFVDCIAKLQFICIGEWDDLIQFIREIQACK